MRAAAALAIALCACAATAARAQTGAPVQQALLKREATAVREIPAGYGHLLKLTTGPSGNVRVAAWRERFIRVEMRLELNAPTEADLDTLASVVDTVFDPASTSVDVTTKGPHDKAWMKDKKGFPKALATMPWRIDYVVHVPEYTSLTLLVHDGETGVEGVNGIVSIVSARGPVRLVNVAGPARVEAGGGDVEVSTRERSWRGGNLSVTASGTLVLRAPKGFSADVDAAAPGGVILTGGQPSGQTPEYHGALGAGGAGVTLLSATRVEIVLE